MVDIVEKDELRIEPPEFKMEWNKWLSNPRDWCISRQLWWGHRIPAFAVTVKGRE
jgi:valyl-tRNA synthetase